jgi:DNA mismatch repair protein MutS
MTFRSILNPSLDGDAKTEMSQTPAYFVDLNLDQIVAAITAGKQEYNLAPFFHEPLRSREAIEYRQEVMRDLENDARYDAVTRFANAMRSAREQLNQAGSRASSTTMPTG